MDKINTQITNLLSMAMRAGKLFSGDYAVTRAIEEKRAIIICIANDVSLDTKDKYEFLSKSNQIPLLEIPLSKIDLGSCIGKNERAAIAICDGGFANAIRKIFR